MAQARIPFDINIQNELQSAVLTFYGLYKTNPIWRIIAEQFGQIILNFDFQSRELFLSNSGALNQPVSIV